MATKKSPIRSVKPATTSSSPHAKILLVEDDAFISHAYKDGLERAGLEVLLATDGEQAMTQLHAHRPQLVLLDLIMPIKNGFEVLTELQQDKKYKGIPVIVLSNLGQDSDMAKAKALGAVDYFIKSNTSMKEVIEKVKGYLH